MDLKKYLATTFGSGMFSLSKYLRNYWHTIIMTWAEIKPPKHIMYVLVQCN